jgi:hypothetical protein
MTYNAWLYVFSNPASRVDPSGNIPQLLLSTPDQCGPDGLGCNKPCTDICGLPPHILNVTPIYKAYDQLTHYPCSYYNGKQNHGGKPKML